MSDSDLKEIGSLCLDWLDRRSNENAKDIKVDVDRFSWSMDDLPEDEEYRRLCQLVDQNAQLPTPPLATHLKRKAEIELDRGRVEDAAYSLMHSAAIGLRHQALFLHGKKIRRERERTEGQSLKKQVSTKDLFDDDDDGEDQENVEDIQKRTLSFQNMNTAETVKRMRSMLSELPSTWRVVQLSVRPTLKSRFKTKPADKPVEETNYGLVVVVAGCGQNAGHICVQKVLPVDRADCPTILKELSDVVSRHRQIYEKTDKFDRSVYNESRDEIDDRMTALLNSVENKWLGFAKALLLGQPISPDRTASVASAVASALRAAKVSLKDAHAAALVHKLFDAAHALSLEQLVDGLSEVKGLTAGQVKDVAKAANRFGVDSNAECWKAKNRHPVVLVLDPEIQALPWESLHLIREQPCSRVPSVFFLCSLYAAHSASGRTSVTHAGVRRENTFYILNPNSDLPNTQKRLEKQFESSLGEGVVGAWPSQQLLSKALSEKDAFLYCGHGSRMKNLSAQDIEKLNVKAVPLLFGCNSGRLERIGRSLFDPIGTATSYLIATSPSLLGFLWSVTDLDLDTWTVDFLRHWLGPDAKQRDFVRAVADKRGGFRRILNSAATVVYGLPEFFH